MAGKTKTFDCVEMKNSIQAKLAEERSRLGDEEFNRRRKEWLETSNDPLARWWRSLTAAEQSGTEST